MLFLSIPESDWPFLSRMFVFMFSQGTCITARYCVFTLYQWHTSCSKISPVHLQTRQEHQNGRVWTSLGSKLEETTTLDVLHYPMGSEIGPVHLHLPQERQNGGVQTSLQPKVEETTTLSVSYYPMVSKSVWYICTHLRSARMVGLELPWDPK